ncbi:MAG TPA: hypothetical protein VFV64_00520 [Permianibacter sp.]|nr:hypothetical protein [Permianibacter sp.]
MAPLADHPRLVLTRQPRLPFERAFVVLMLGLLIGLPLLFVLRLSAEDPSAPAQLLERLSHDPRLYFLPLALIAALYWQRRQRQHEQLRLDDQGLHYTPPFRWWRQPAFRVKWAEVTALELRPPQRGYPLNTSRLHVHTGSQHYALQPLQWYPPAISWAQQRARQKLQAMRRTDVETAFANSAVGQFLAARGMNVRIATHQPAPFDLFSHRICTVMVALIAVLLLYALLDGATLQQRALEQSLWPLLIGVGVLSFPAPLLLLVRSAVPRAEAIGVAALVAVAVGAAAYPGSLRVNQLSDWDGAETVFYRHQGNGHFVADGFPAVTQEAFDPFWDQLPQDASYPLRLYRGSLGFWQLDEAPINDAMRAYYRRQRGETE